MKNSVNNPSPIQALQIRSEQLLPIVNRALVKLGYKYIIPQRISQQNDDTSVYQGLMRATDDNFGQVMIKWEISADIYYDLTSLGHDIKVLKTLDSFQIEAQTSITIAPQILADKSSIINVLDKNYQLTILVMPYYPQGSLVKYLKQSLINQQKQQLIAQAAKLINNLHKQGWLHNDIKPSNIIVNSNPSTISNDKSSCLLLTDFALATRIDNSSDQKVTLNSAGTPAYLAPERWQGCSATLQSDVYAFGIMVYEILTGNRPFKIKQRSGEPLKDWAIQHCQQPVQLLPENYPCYQQIINKLLSKRVEKRYQGMEEVLLDLQLLKNK